MASCFCSCSCSCSCSCWYSGRSSIMSTRRLTEGRMPPFSSASILSALSLSFQLCLSPFSSVSLLSVLSLSFQLFLSPISAVSILSALVDTCCC